MRKFRNEKKKKFLASLDLPSLEDENNDLTKRCKFNFSYLDSSQDAGQTFGDWTHNQLIDLLGKLKAYTKEPLDYWRNQRAGNSGLNVLETYVNFPNNSAFVYPKYIPHQAQWGRFRLGSKVRLVGFTIPTELHRTSHKKTGEFFDNNTFYLVFLDRDHKFYLTENK